MKFLKYLFLFLIILFVGGCFVLKTIGEERPSGITGPEADGLAKEVLMAIDKPAFDSIPYLQWEFFRPGQRYLWDKERNFAIIEWKTYKVIMDLDEVKAVSYKNGNPQSGDAHEKLKAKAWSNWCNDSFWMLAPFKLFDNGTERTVVDLEDGRKGLMVSYKSGGVTPGDSYLWELGKDNIPTGWKMWTKILPIDGLYTSWEGWENHKGALLSTKHILLGKEVTMNGVKSGNSYTDFGFDKDPFLPLYE